MKKHLLFLTFVLVVSSLAAQDTITGWTFPANSGPDSLDANLGLPGNLGYDIRFEGDDTTYNTVYFINGAENYAAAAAGWEDGADEKFWSIKFKAENFSDIKVSSTQYSDPANPGPADFKLQWRLSGGNWSDIAGGTVTVGEDWTTGIVDQLPTGVTGQGTSSVYIRWIMASNTNTAGNPVEANGISGIDNILVTGKNHTGVNEVLYSNQICLFPNPTTGTFTLNSQTPLTGIRIYDLRGNLVYETTEPSFTNRISLDPVSGIFFVTATIQGSDARWSTRIIVQ